MEIETLVGFIEHLTLYIEKRKREGVAHRNWLNNQPTPIFMTQDMLLFYKEKDQYIKQGK